MALTLYGIDSPSYTDTSTSIEGLIDNVLAVGADPSCKLTINGEVTDETLWDYMEDYV